MPSPRVTPDEIEKATEILQGLEWARSISPGGPPIQSVEWARRRVELIVEAALSVAPAPLELRMSDEAMVEAEDIAGNISNPPPGCDNPLYLLNQAECFGTRYALALVADWKTMRAALPVETPNDVRVWWLCPECENAWSDENPGPHHMVDDEGQNPDCGTEPILVSALSVDGWEAEYRGRTRKARPWTTLSVDDLPHLHVAYQVESRRTGPWTPHREGRRDGMRTAKEDRRVGELMRAYDRTVAELRELGVDIVRLRTLEAGDREKGDGDGDGFAIGCRVCSWTGVAPDGENECESCFVEKGDGDGG